MLVIPTDRLLYVDGPHHTRAVLRGDFRCSIECNSMFPRSATQ